MEALLADALKPAPREPDIMRDTLVRYLGYANEVGESFRAIAPKLVVWAPCTEQALLFCYVTSVYGVYRRPPTSSLLGTPSLTAR